MRINTKELYEITERTFNEYKSPREDTFITKDVAGFNVDIGTVKYILRIHKGTDDLLIIRIYSKNEKLLTLINVEPNHSGFEDTKSKWFGVYIQCLLNFGQIRLY